MSNEPDRHWASQRERGSLAGMRLVAWLLRHLGRRGVRPVVSLIVFYFYATGRQARRHVHRYQSLLAAHARRPELVPSRWTVWRQFQTFSTALLDKIDVWQGRIRYDDLEIDDPDDVRGDMAQGRGQMLVSAHLGNPEVCRALAESHGHVRVNVLVHTRHAERFNRLLAESGASSFRLIQVSDIDPATLIRLRQCLDDGEWVAIAGDRTPPGSRRTVPVDFLGAEAEFPQGPWLLAGLLECPVNLMYCVRLADGRYRVRFERFTERVGWTRATRAAVVQELAQRFADSLSAECVRSPMQWFNFFDFWKSHA